MLENANAAKSNRASGRGGRCGLEELSAMGSHWAEGRAVGGRVPAEAVECSKGGAWDP